MEGRGALRFVPLAFGLNVTATAHPGFTVLVNSSDGYEDCWDPFFRLFNLHWPACQAPILLNTELKDWSCPYLPVRCSRVQAAVGRRLSWSECLLAALDQVTTPLVLYFHEDYFLQAPADVPTIEALASEMLRDRSVRHIGLTHYGASGPFTATADPRLWRISRRSPYRISTQAGLWHTETLRRYLREPENAWMFEILGTWRARLTNEQFLTVNRDCFGPGRRVLDYIHTGIVRGRWHRDIPAVFERFGVRMRFEDRGFYTAPGWLMGKLETVRRVLFQRDTWRALWPFRGSAGSRR